MPRKKVIKSEPQYRSANLEGLHKEKRLNRKTAFAFCVAVLLFGIAVEGLGAEVPWEARATIGITLAAIVLWASEVIPFGLTSLLVLVSLVMTGACTVEVALSGFSKGAVYLIVGGMMMAQAVNHTALGKRLTYALMARTKGDMKRILWAVILVPQMLALFIPATSVRTALLLPLVLSIVNVLHLPERSGAKKQLLVGLAFGANVSGTAILPAAIGNVLTVEILDIYLKHSISYIDWFWYTFPVWFAMIPTTWWCIRRAFPAERETHHALTAVMQQKLQALGPLTSEEKRCLLILAGTVFLWMSAEWHGLDPAIPALLAVVAMSLPGVGVATWREVVQVDYGLVLLLGSTLSLGIVLNNSGAIDVVTQWLKGAWFVHLAEAPFLLIVVMIVMAHLYHLAVSNISTAVVTFLPMVIGVALEMGVNPVVLSVLSAITILYGFLLVVETLPTVLVHGTGEINQRDFWRAGVPLTVGSIMILTLVAVTWWKWITFA